MNGTKSLITSKGVMGGVGTMMMGLLMIVGAVQPGAVDVAPIAGVDPNVVGQVMEAAQGGGAVLAGVVTMALGALAVIGRLMATKGLSLLGNS